MNERQCLHVSMKHIFFIILYINSIAHNFSIILTSAHFHFVGIVNISSETWNLADNDYIQTQRLHSESTFVRF